MEYTDEYMDALIEELQKYDKYKYEPAEKIKNKFRTVHNLTRELRTLRAIDRQHELIEVLKTTNKYQGLTTEEIEDMFDTIDELNNEVQKVIREEQDQQEKQYEKAREQDIYNTTLLTGNRDVGYNILLNMDIKDLARYCMVNTTANYDICNNGEFWVKKIKHDGFDYDIYFDGNIMNRFPDLMIYYNNKKFSDYFQLYNNIALSKKYAEYILKIYNIENKDIKNYANQYGIVIKGNKKLILIIVSLFMAGGGFTTVYNNIKENAIFITYTKENKNNFIILIRTNTQPIAISIDYDKLKFLLMRAIFLQLKYETLNIVDKNDKPYIISSNPQNINIESKRYGMIQAFDNC